MRTHEAQLRRYRPLIAFERNFPGVARRRLRMLLLALCVVGGLGYFVLTVNGAWPAQSSFDEVFFLDSHVYLGIFYISFSLLISLYLISFFYNTHYYRTVRSSAEPTSDVASGLTFEAAVIIEGHIHDITKGFLLSEYGRFLFTRIGIPRPAIEAFIADPKRPPISLSDLALPPNAVVTPGELALQIYGKDEAVITLCQDHSVTTEVYTSANQWIDRRILWRKKHSRWWSKDNLMRHQPLGSELSYGVAYELKRYTKNIYSSSVFSIFARGEKFSDTVLEKVQATLAREQGGNAILVGEPGVGKMDIVIELARRINENKVPPTLAGKHVMSFDADAFAATFNTKQDFEPAFIRLLSQAEKAGNVVIVFEGLSTFLTNVESLGSNAAELIDRFASSQELNVIATDTPDGYHRYVERHPQLLQKFTSLYMDDPTLKSVVHILENAVESYEHKYHIFFTYPAILAIAAGADRYLVEGAMPERAVSLLSEIAAAVHTERHVLVSKNYVETYIAQKTGIPVGPVIGDERQKLLDLENILHQRVVGQHAAVTAIAGTMRRVRAGITSADRPLGSFLFLGATGVGKTETAKTLAEVFFGSESKMVRIDMSEFNSDDALERMIGESGESGLLAMRLRENPYCVLLLDEFEKGATRVHDLFLQILDEGQFTDGRGKKVNAHNVIVIATSNAGSEKIWEMAEAGKNPASAKDEIIDLIITKRIFKPELLNRFDATIIFETLKEDQQIDIAHILLQRLQKRIEKKGYQLQITEDLVNYVARKGFDPEFGARPMRRVIQDDIEERIATKIISGGMRPGDTILFSKDDLALL